MANFLSKLPTNVNFSLLLKKLKPCPASRGRLSPPPLPEPLLSDPPYYPSVGGITCNYSINSSVISELV